MKSIIFKSLIALLAVGFLVASGGIAQAQVSLPTATLNGSVNTTAAELTFSISLTRVDYADGTSFAIANGPDESIILAEMVISGATRTGPLSFADAAIEIRNPADLFQYFTGTLTDINFLEVAPGVYYLNLMLDATNPTTLNISNLALNSDATHPSRFISELQAGLGANSVMGMKLGFFVTGDITGVGAGTVFDGLLDGISYLPPQNNPPTADAGATTANITCLATSCDINLDGSQSSDPDSTPGTNDDIVSFEWFIDADNDGTLSPGELLATGETATVSLPLGMHEVSLKVTDSAGASDVSSITIVIDPAELSFIEIDKAHVKRNGKVKIRGRLALPAGVTHSAVNSIGRAIIGVSSLGTVIDESVNFTENGNGNKWKYKASPALGLKKFMIDWDGAKFNYQNGLFTVKSDHIGDDETSLEINSCSPVTVDINGVTISIDANDIVTVNDSTTKVDGDDDGDSDDVDDDHGNSADDDDGDCAVQATLPFALTPDMVMTITGSVSDTITIGDYFTAAVGKFKIDGRFDPGTVDFSTLTPSLDLTVTLGDQGFNGTLVIDQTAWTKVKPKYWMFRLK